MPLPEMVRGIPIFGSGLQFQRDALGFLMRTSKRYGDVVRVHLGPMKPTLISHPDLVGEVLVTNAKIYQKDRYLRGLYPLLGNGLLVSGGDFWKRQRRLAQPPFHAKRIGNYADTFVAFTKTTLDRWRDGSVVDVHAEMMRLTLEIVGKTLFGADVSDTARDVGHAIEAVAEHFLDPVRLMLPLTEHLPLPRNVRFKRGIRRLDQIVMGLVFARRALPKVAEDDPNAPTDLLAMLMNAEDEDGTRMSDRQVRDEVMTLFLAGHETTAITLTWTLYLLTQNPGIMRELTESVRQVLGDRPATAADVAQLKFVERVVLESMRLYPPVWSLGRESLEATSLGGFDVPKGAHVWLAPWAIHRDARWFPEPTVFRPDRFLGDWQKVLPKHAYLPFGAGPRICIGNAFAMLELTLVLASLLQRVSFDLVPGQSIIPAPGITLRPRHGLKLKITRVKQN